jgi:hypothetical protein
MTYYYLKDCEKLIFSCLSDAPGVGDELGDHDGGGGQRGSMQVIINIIFL